MSNSKIVGKLDTKRKEDIAAIEQALKAKYESRKNSVKPSARNKKEVPA